MTTLVLSVVLGSWALLFGLLAVLPLLPDLPATDRGEDLACVATCPATTAAERRAA